MSLEIAGRRVGRSAPLFVIAEIGLNHGGSLDRALKLVDAAAESGASAVKVQVTVADDLVGAHCPAPAHVQASSLREFFRRFELDRRAYQTLCDRAHANGLAFIATPFSPASVSMLEEIGVDAYKIASGDLTYSDLIARVGNTVKPAILSTGMASLAEVETAVTNAHDAGVRRLALLHCVSAYPVPAGSENLLAISTLRHALRVPVGLSDHAGDASSVPIIVALGASLYERHLMLDGDEGVDAAVSSTPAQVAALVSLAARARRSLGDGQKRCLPAEAVNVTASRRSLHSTRRLQAGHVIGPRDVTALRPATGLALDALPELVGQTLQRDVEAGTPFLPGDLQAGRSAREVA